MSVLVSPSGFAATRSCETLALASKLAEPATALASAASKLSQHQVVVASGALRQLCPNKRRSWGLSAAGKRNVRGFGLRRC